MYYLSCKQMTQDSSKQNFQEGKITRVGVLVVHGIGKQKQFEHLICIVRNIAQALKNDNSQGSLDVQMTIRTCANAAFGAAQKTWAADTKAPVVVTVKDQLGDITQLEFHEVWWADLGEPTTLGTLWAFWYWGLSLWTIRGYFEHPIDRLHNKVRLPQKERNQGNNITNTKVTILERVILFGISLIAWLILPLLAVFSRLLSIFDIHILPLDALSQYMSLEPHPVLKRRGFRLGIKVKFSPVDSYLVNCS
ncbi:hypothetical protein [Microseira wollei]|uniref:Uncharacterized protein n=1 Tax=Microseira wollei NIES-4236 TaxID=2530354 RepID=A0AAV3XFG3_9CYAN|nr:hypothetical protein [Microseira wollei]GET40236.1 hypothetical protein MiSe_50450 [Microseira wollei NIES-4236]